MSRLKPLAFILLALSVVYLLLVVRARPVDPHPFFLADRVMVIAHQGGDGLRPSNTMAAFQHAADLGVDVLEMDIHSTADGVLVVIHDATVDRTTDGSGPVQSFTLAELRQFDAGYHWPTLAEESHRSDRPFRAQGITIPALEEVIQAFPDYRFNIEIKQQEPSIVVPFCALLRENDITEQTLVASFHAETIQEFRQTCPEVATSAVEGEIRTFYIAHRLFLSRVVPPPAYAFQVPEYSGGLHVVTERFVRDAGRLNIDVHPWTINESDNIARMLTLGVDGIITDYPDRVLEQIKNEK